MPSRDDNRAAELASLREEVRRLHKTLDRLTPGIETLLKRRGFRIYKKEPVADLIIPAEPFLDEYYALLHKYSFRLFLRDVIKHQASFTPEQVTRYATAEATRSYINSMSDAGLIERTSTGYALARQPITSFGATLEWYLAQVFKREFGSEAMWGVKFKRPQVGGDYDVLARINGSLLYAEVKSSPPKQIYDSEIAAFLDRVEDLVPEIAIFLMDTELRMKDKIVPMFEMELASRRAEPPAVVRIERELFEVGNRIFIVNAKEDIVRNLEQALYRYYKKTNLS